MSAQVRQWIWEVLPPAPPGIGKAEIIRRLAKTGHRRSKNAVEASQAEMRAGGALRDDGGWPIRLYWRGVPLEETGLPVLVEWTEEVKEELRRRWLVGESGAAIGRHLGASKSAVIGKAHRMGLPERPSPIIEGAQPKRDRRRVPVPQGSTLPPMRQEAAPKPGQPAPRAAPKVPAKAAHVPLYGRVALCCWPIGAPGTREFRFCDISPVVPGKPYCAEHCSLAYIRGRARCEDEAPIIGGFSFRSVG